MDILALSFLFGILLVVIIEIISLIIFLSGTRQSSPKFVNNQYKPRTLVILCLRGADATLPQCLEGLFNQDYSNFEIRIVVDNDKDPAWEIVNQFLKGKNIPVVKAEVLKTRPATAGLKNCALIQVLKDLDPSVEVVAQIDSDVIPHPQWLKELVTPLDNPQIGATMGNRWYVPVKDSWGSLLQYSSNAFAVPFMYLKSIPWAGTFAIKTHIIREGRVLEWLEKSIIDDNVFYQALHSQGMQLKFVPSLMMLQKDSPALSSVINFQIRQHLWTRLYHPQWGLSLFVSMAIVLILAGSLGILILSMIRSSWLQAFYSAFGLSFYFLSTLILFWLMEKKIGSILRDRGAQKEPWFHYKLFLSIPLGLVFNAYSQILALFTRKITWRGVTYLIQGPWQIQRVPETNESIR